MKKLSISISLIFLASIINSCMIIKRPLSTKAVFKVNYERRWISETDVVTEKYYLQHLDYLLQVEHVGKITEPFGIGDFFLKYTIIYDNYPRNYAKSTRYLHIIPEDDIFHIYSRNYQTIRYPRSPSNNEIDYMRDSRWHLKGYSNDDNLLEAKILEYYFKNKARIDRRNKNFSNKREDRNVGEITMTTSGKEISFDLDGTGTITLDWGDGSPARKLEFVDWRGALTFSRQYPDEAPRTITIIGSNITNLRRIHGVTSLDVSRSNALIKLNCSNTGLTELIINGNSTLKELDCSGNQLTELNLNGITALTVLNCDDNELTTLDLSQNTALKTLTCAINQLTALDLSRNTLLEILFCVGNELTSLDLSQNTALKKVNCSFNPLKSLNVSRNTALTELKCQYTRLTNLDLRQNTALEELHVFEALLTTLDVSQNLALEWLWCDNNRLTELDVSRNSALTRLWCDYNQLTALDVSKNRALRSLSCSNNQLTELDVSQNRALRSLFCSNNQLTELDVSQNSELAELIVNYNKLTALDMSQNSNLFTLSCQHNLFTADALNDLFGTLHRNNIRSRDGTRDKSVDIRNNPGTDDCNVRIVWEKGWEASGFRGGASIIRRGQNPNIETISSRQIISDTISDNSIIMTTGAKEVRFALTGVGSAIINWNDGSTPQTVALGDGKIQRWYQRSFDNTELRNITITGDSILGLHCYNNELIALDVSRSKTLKHLHCERNFLTVLDLSQNAALEELRCSVNQLTELDVANNPLLKILYCYENQLTKLDVSLNTALTDLRFYENNLTTLDVSQNTALISLDFNNNRINELDLSHNIALTEVHCIGNQFSAEALNELFTTLHNNDFEKFIRIIRNPGSADCDPGIAEAKGWRVSR